MRADEIRVAARHFHALTAKVPLRIIRSEAGYDHAVAVLNELLDAGGADEDSDLAGLVDALGKYVKEWDDAHYEVHVRSSPQETLAYLMERHGLTQRDLPEVGSQGVVSEILAGKRRLNVRQIGAVSKRFHVSADLFLEPKAVAAGTAKRAVPAVAALRAKAAKVERAGRTTRR